MKLHNLIMMQLVREFVNEIAKPGNGEKVILSKRWTILMKKQSNNEHQQKLRTNLYVIFWHTITEPFW